MAYRFTWVLLCLALFLPAPVWGQAEDGATPPADAVPAELASPRATMFTFLKGMNDLTDSSLSAKDRLRVVASVLACFNFADANEGANLGVAEQLYGVLNRLGTVTPEELPDDKTVADLELKRYVYFPRFPEHTWVKEKLGQYPEGKVALTRAPDGRWLFSARTVSETPDLHAAMAALEDRHGAQSQIYNLVGPTFTRTPWWGWAGLLVLIFVGLVVGKLFQTGFRAVAKRATQRQQLLRAAVFHDAASPLSLLCLTVGIHLGLGGLVLGDGLRDFAMRFVALLYLLTVGWLLYNLVDVIDHWLTRITSKTHTKLDDMVVPLIRKALRIFLVIIFTLVVAQNVFGLNILSFLAGLGLAGLAISLAAQDSVKNLFGSLTVFFDKPFLIGDRINFDGIDGTVEEIGFRSTRVRTLVGHLVTIPNMKFIDNNVENIAARPSIRRILDVTITYDTPPEKVEEAVRIIRDMLAEPQFAAEFDMDKNPPRVYFNEYNAASLNIRVMYWYRLGDSRDWWTYNQMSEQFNHRLLRAYSEAGIEFAFPTQTLYLAGDPNRELTVQVVKNEERGTKDKGE
ncbi:MAG: mechanosensitive ion channel family protein [Phycisphaeraceae bacterium]